MKLRYTCSTLLLTGLVMVLLTACKKEGTVAPPPDPSYANRIPFVLGDNGMLETNVICLRQAGLIDTLTSEGPFTMLALQRQAYLNTGISASQPITEHTMRQWLSQPEMHRLYKYLILRGRLNLRELPVPTDKAFETISGTNVYVRKFKKGEDTVITINGSIPLSIDNRAANGLIHVLSEVPNPETHTSLISAIRNDSRLTLFATALLHSGLADSLQGLKSPYTLIAPHNDAFKSSTLNSAAAILAANPAQVANLVRYHLISGRYFTADILRLAATQQNEITMRNGGIMKIGGSLAAYNSISFRDQQGQEARLSRKISIFPFENYANQPAGNGVVHIIDRVLNP